MRIALQVAGWLLFVAYPAAVYYGLTHLGLRRFALWIVPFALGLALLRSRGLGGSLRTALFASAVVTVPLLLGVLLDAERLALLSPVLINLGLLFTFAGSLRTTPIVERFARLQVRDLSVEEVEYCRAVTLTWSLFFVANGATAGLLAWLAPPGVWAVYTGGIAYVLIGTLGATEYVIRKWRFGRYGRSPIDRALRALLPKRPEQPLDPDRPRR